MVLKKYVINTVVCLVPFVILLLIQDLAFNNDVWLGPKDPIEISKQYLKKEFLNNKDTLLVKIDLDHSFFEQSTLDSLREVGTALENIPLVHTFKTPLHSTYISNSDEVLNIQTFDSALENKIIKNLAEYEAEFDQSDYAGLLLSEDHQQFLIVIKASIGDTNKHAKRTLIINQASAILAKSVFKDYHFAGKVFLDYRLNQLSKSNLIKLFLTSTLIIFLVLLWIYRDFTKLFITLYVAVIASLTSLLVIQLHNNTLTTINIVLPLIVITIAISDGVHIVAKWQNLCLNFPDMHKKQRLKKLIRSTYKPCLITSITTAIGFGSFGFSDIIPLEAMAQQAVISIGLAYVIIVALTWVLIYINDISLENGVDFNFVKKQVPQLVTYVEHWPKVVLFFTFILVAFFAYGLSKVYSESSFLNIFFKKSSPIYQTFTEIDTALGGSGEIDLLIQTEKKDNFNRFENLEYIQNLVKQIAMHPDVKHVRSYVNPVRSIHEKVRNDDSQLPKNDEEFAQEVLFLEFSRDDSSNDVLSDYVNFDYSTARINIKTDNLTSKQIGKLSNYVSGVAKGHTLAGQSMYFYRISLYVNQIQLESILATFTTVFLVMLLFYSFKIALIALFLNVIPVVVVGGLIAHLDIPFDFATVMISAISFAIAVDNSIHLIDHYNGLQIKNTTQRIIANLSYISKPLAINTLLFSVSFLVFVFADLVLLIKFGIFSFISVACAFVVNMVLSVVFLR